MRSGWLWVMLSAAVVPGHGAAAAPALRLADGGRALVTIVTAPEATPAETTAAKELAGHLLKITGASFAVVAEPQLPAGTPAVYVGPTAYARRAGVDPAALGEEEWVIRTVDGNLLIAGGRPRGTLFGVYEFLEQHGGCAWLDHDTSVIARRPTFEVSAIAERGRPAFWSRSYYTGFSHGADTFHVRNKHMLHSYDAKYGYQAGFGSPGNCHTFYAYSQDWPDVPEYWALTGAGKRRRPTSASDVQFCLTHPEVRKLTLAKLRAYIRQDRERAAAKGAPPPRIYDISHNDGLGYCLCPGCKAVLEREGAYSGVMLDFINEIARGIRDEYPDILIQTFAYTFTLDPPRHIKPERNVLMLVCDLGSEWYPLTHAENLRSVLHPDNQRFQNTLQAWAAIAPHLAVWDYWKIYRPTFAYTNVSALQPDLRFFRDHRVGRIFVEGEDLDDGSFAALKQWLGLKLMDNPDRPARELIESFLRGYYGPAAQPLGEYLSYLEQRIATTPGSFGRRHPMDWPYFDRPFFEHVNALLDRAEALTADNPLYLAHVRRERVPVDYARLFLWERLHGTAATAEKQAVLTRYAANRAAALRVYHGGTNLSQQLARLDQTLKLFRAMPIPLPAQFQGKQVVDVLWPDFPSAERVEDPQATAGMAVKLGARPNDAAFHVLPLTLGVYDGLGKKAGPGLALKQADIPTDGKYHFHRLGTWPIGEKTYVWVHWTWLLQIHLTKAYQAPLARKMDIWVSLKALGPAYVKGATDENGVYVDRIILVEAD